MSNANHNAGGVTRHDSHHDDHHLGSRRKFLRQLGLLTTGTALLPNSPLQALGSSALAQALLDLPNDRVLVLIRLKGGNDGLNTVVPLYDYATYRNARPQLAYREADLLSVSDELALSTDFSDAHGLWQRGSMSIVNGVGYPEPNLSHFRGTDIITSASDAREVWSSGWLGRHLDRCFPEYLTAPPEAPPAIQIGGGGSLTFTNDENLSLAVTVSSVEELAKLAETGQVYDLQNLPDCLYGEQLGYLRGIANSAFVFAGGIEAAYGRGNTAAEYPAGQLAAQLAVVARLIKGGLGTQLYMVTLEGFDTHAGQEDSHPLLLQQLGSSVRAFFDDLSDGGHDQRVLATTFSEFGRRIEENASGGTDHGTAAPQLLFGPSLAGGTIAGEAPTVSSPDVNGNLTFTTDFRSVYATLLESWLCVPGDDVDAILGENFPRLDLGISCTTVGVGSRPAVIAGVKLTQTSNGWALDFESTGGAYTIEAIDISGRTLAKERSVLSVGQSRLSLPLPRTVSGVYAYRLTAPSGASKSGLVPAL